MTVRDSLTMIKLTSLVFVSATIVFAVKYYDGQNKNKKLKETILLDKKTYTNDLREIFNRYDSALLKNKQLLETNFLEQKPANKANTIILKKEKNTVVSSPVNKAFIKNIDSLNLILKKQDAENKALTNQLEILVAKNKELQKQNSNNENILTVSKNLTATNVYANGIKIMTNNIIETKRFNNTEQIKVCFTLLENKSALKGNKDIYIQIVNPKNKIVSKNGGYIGSGDRLLDYSAKTNIFYDNEDLDVCVFVDPNKDDILKGDYEINIFSGISLIGNTVFSLK